MNKIAYLLVINLVELVYEDNRIHTYNVSDLFHLFSRNIWSRGEFYRSFLYAPARHWCALSSGHRAMCGTSTERDKILGKFHLIVSQFPWNVTRFRTMRP